MLSPAPHLERDGSAEGRSAELKPWEELQQLRAELREPIEEVVASHQGLQLAHEELEASREELRWINCQLVAKIKELERITDNLSNDLSRPAAADPLVHAERRPPDQPPPARHWSPDPRPRAQVP